MEAQLLFEIVEEDSTFINSPIIHGPIGLETVDGSPLEINPSHSPGQLLHSLMMEPLSKLTKMDPRLHHPQPHIY